MKTVTLIFDGGSRGNPGLSYGSFRIQWEGKRFGSPHRERFGHGTNNEAEYKALLAGLEQIEAEARNMNLDPQTLRLEIRGDSALVVEQVNGRWKVKSLSLQLLHDQTMEQLAVFGEHDIRRQTRGEVQRMLGH